METTTRPVTPPPAGPNDGASAPPEKPSASPAPAAKPKRSMPPALRLALIVAGAIALVFIVIWGFGALGYAMTHESTDDAQIDADEVQITSKIAERVDHIYVDTNQLVHKGQLLVSLDDVDERTRLRQAQAVRDAQVAQAHAAVKTVDLTRDQVAAQNQQNQGSISQAQANISSAASQAKSSAKQISVAQAAVTAAEAQLRVAQEAVPGAQENLRKADADLQRTQALVSTGDVAVQQLDADRASEASARSSYDQAQSNVLAAQAQLAQAQQKLDSQIFATNSTESLIGVQQAGLVTAEGKLEESDSPNRVAAQQAQAASAFAQVATANAQLRAAEDQVSYTQIHSPIDGYVGEKDVEVGRFVASGDPLMTLIPSTNVYITANFKETQVGHMRAGLPVDINVDACNGVPIAGHVQTLSPASQNKFSLVPAQNATGNFVKVTQRVPVRIVFDHPNDSRCVLRPGMSVEVSVKKAN